MEWHFTTTPQILRRSIAAKAKTPGTAVHRAWMRGVAASAMLAVGVCVLMGPRMPDLWGHPLLVLFTLALLLAVLWPLSLSPAAFARNRVLALRINRQLAEFCRPCTVTLEGAVLCMTGGELGAGRGDWRCPAAELARAVAVKDGVLVVCKDGRALFLPGEALGAGQSVPACIGQLSDAIAAAQGLAAPAADAPAGWEPTPSGGILRFTLGEEQARALCRQLNAAVLRTGAYWRRQWWSWLLLAASVWFLLAMLARLLAPTLLPAAAPAALLVVGSSMALRLLGPGNVKNLLGPQMLTLTADGLYLTRQSGHWSYPYTRYETLLETADALFLYNGRNGAAQIVPKSAFADAGQQAAFTALVRARLGQGG